jgi:hypothetical protein
VATRRRRLSFVFLVLALIGFTFFQISTPKNLCPKRMANWVAIGFQWIEGFVPVFGHVARDQMAWLLSTLRNFDLRLEPLFLPPECLNS